jgi:23S rRNA pseudouridine2605 synthase
LTAEQLEASRAERMRLNGNGTITLEDARTWIEETGFCLFLPKRQYSTSIAPSFVEAVAGQQNATPDPKHIALAEELLVRLEADDVAVRLNLLGLVGEQPDFVVASWVLPYVYALRGDRDWRRSPQLTGSRQVSQLAVQAYKQLETGDANIATLTHALGREVTAAAVLRSITELWQQLRIIPVVAAPGQPAKWQLLRQRYQKAIAEGASTSQVTAISVLASIYLQAVIAASMEEVELFLAPLTARSKVREVLRGLVATRQVHTISLGHAPLFYVAGTLPEFAVAPTLYSSSSMPASAYFLGSLDHEHDLPEPVQQRPAASSSPAQAAPRNAAEPHAPRISSARKPAASAKPAAARPHFSRPATHSRDRKPAQSSAGSHPVRRSTSESRPAAARSANGSRTASSSRPASGARNGAHSAAGSSNGNGSRSKVNSSARTARPANGASSARTAKSSAPAWSQRNGHGNGAKSAGNSGTGTRKGAPARGGGASAASSRSDARGNSRKPALAAGTKAGNSKQFGFTARPKSATKKRG